MSTHVNFAANVYDSGTEALYLQSDIIYRVHILYEFIYFVISYIL